MKGMKIYPKVSFEYESNILKFSDDALFLLHEIELDDKSKEAIFGTTELKLEKPETQTIDDTVRTEFDNIKKLLDLKNKDNPNYYFYKDNYIYFNFYNIYVRKKNNFRNIYTDIIGLKFLIFMFGRTKSEKFDYGRHGNKFVFKGDDFYFEGHNIQCEETKKSIIYNFFKDFKKKSEFVTKLEFYNFVSTIVSYSPKCALIFDDDNSLVHIQSAEGNFSAEFKVEGMDDYFLMPIVIMIKVLSFILRYVDKIDEFNFSIGMSEDTKWMKTEIGDVELLTEIRLTSVNDLEDDEDYFAEETE
jgi:hypothetical protein